MATTARHIEKEQREEEGEMVRRRRKALGMTQIELAAALGTTQTTIARWERGAAPIANWVMLDKALRYEEMSKITKTP